MNLNFCPTVCNVIIIFLFDAQMVPELASEDPSSKLYGTIL